MYFEERQEGPYRIFAVASVCGQGGYLAGAAVCRVVESGAPERLFFSAALADGFQFADPKAALNYGLEVGTRALRQQTAGAT